MSLEGQSNGTLYEDVGVDVGNKINADVFIDEEEKHVYVMTPRKVRTLLTLSMLGKIPADDILKYFYFSPENRLWHFLQIVFFFFQKTGFDIWNVKACFQGKISKILSICCLLN